MCPSSPGRERSRGVTRYGREQPDNAIEIDGGELRATAYGEAVDIVRQEPAVEIKGATLTALRVAHGPDGWRAQCVVDV